MLIKKSDNLKRWQNSVQRPSKLLLKRVVIGFINSLIGILHAQDSLSVLIGSIFLPVVILPINRCHARSKKSDCIAVNFHQDKVIKNPRLRKRGLKSRSENFIGAYNLLRGKSISVVIGGSSINVLFFINRINLMLKQQIHPF
jgi:hypothetical protein